MEHAELAPSSAERIVLCNGSARMEAMFPDEEDTIDKREGVAVHWAGQERLDGAYAIDVGLVADNGVTLTDDMCEAAEMYVGVIMQRGPIGWVEKTIKQAVLHVKNWGTPDHWYYCPVTRTLWIDDLKYGRRFIDVYMNWQLINYAALILAKLGLMGESDIKVIFTLVQPRSYHRGGPVRTWETTCGALREPWAVLTRAFDAAVLPGVKVTPHPTACRDCRARHTCEGAASAAYIGVDMAYQSEPLEMSPQALSREYRMLLQAETFITARRKGIEDRVIQTIRRNRSVPYFGLDRKPGREVWNDDAVANGVVDIAASYGVDIVTDDVPLMTPKQAIKAGVPVHVVKLFSRDNIGGVELVEDDGTRAAQIFNVVQPE